MYYILNENVYLVIGNYRGCIYDFNTSKLYSINKELMYKIALINNEKVYIESIDYNLRSVFNEFVKIGVLKLSEKHISRNIKNIITDFDLQINTAWIEISNRCNLRCIHCYNESNLTCSSVMSVSNYKIVVDNLVKIGVKKVQIIGGEPFLEKENLKEMLEYTVGKFDFIEIFTNGTLITPNWFKYLAENNIYIALSVYSYDAKVHDTVTKCKGSHSKTNKTILELKKNKISYRVCNVLMKDVRIGQKRDNLYELSEKRDIVRMSGRATFALLSDKLIYEKLITKKSFQKPLKETFCKKLLSGHNCFKNRIYIASNMEVFPCVMERRLKHCIITKDSCILINESIQKMNKNHIDECCYCEYRYVCFDCRPDSLSENILEKPWYCTYNPMTGIWEDETIFIENLKKIWAD